MAIDSLLRSADSTTQEYRGDMPPKFPTHGRPGRCLKSESALTFYRRLTSHGPNGAINRAPSRTISLSMGIYRSPTRKDLRIRRTHGEASPECERKRIFPLQILTKIMQNKDNDFVRLDGIDPMFARASFSADLDTDMA